MLYLRYKYANSHKLYSTKKFERIALRHSNNSNQIFNNRNKHEPNKQCTNDKKNNKLNSV